MNLTQITANFTFHYPGVVTFNDDPLYEEIYIRSLADLCSCSEILEFPYDYFGTYKPQIQLIHNETGIIEQELNVVGSEYPPPAQIIINLTIPFEEEVNAVERIGGITERWLSDLLILANLCYPGLLVPASYSITQDDQQELPLTLPLGEMDSFAIQLALEYFIKSKWPYFNPPPLIDAWTWYLSRDIYLQKQGFENDPISRSYNAFCHLFEAPKFYEIAPHLVWAMIGIESLYARKKNKKKQQIIKNIPRILGEDPRFMEDFNKAYADRSRFLHGGRNFPGLYMLGDPDDETDIYNSVSFAAAILIASLHEIIRGNWPLFDAD